MRELLDRLTRNPLLGAEILVTTLFIAVLNLASPVYVINLLNRYVSYGFHGTLVTLTAGMLVAVALQFGFRVCRTRMLGVVCAEPDTSLASRTLDVLVTARSGVLARLPEAKLSEAVGGIQTLQSAYGHTHMAALLDAPFSLLYIVAVFFLSPLLALIALSGMAIALIVGFISTRITRNTAEQLQTATGEHKATITAAVRSVDTVRAFGGGPFLQRLWQGQILRLVTLRLRLADIRERFQSLNLTLNTLMSVCLYAVGAVQAVRGDITVGALIGSNILAARAFQNTIRIVQTGTALSAAREAADRLRAFGEMPLENRKGIVPKSFRGELAFKDMAFGYSGARLPLFESLDLSIDAGRTVVVTGGNGTGKTTLARLVLGLLQPSRGEVRVDGVNLRQVDAAWWRRQVMYLPQEPTFLHGSLQDNLVLGNPLPPAATLEAILAAADLKSFVDSSPEGLQLALTPASLHLPLGIRRRIALARALCSGGPLAVLDEPTEGLDAQGCGAVYALLNQLTARGSTLLVFSNDPLIVKGGTQILDLDQKPVPGLVNNVPGQFPSATPEVQR
jgi:ATP-binding cassette subfamily C protein LapB